MSFLPLRRLDRGKKSKNICDRQRAQMLSLSSEKLEMICEMYHQMLEITQIFEMLDKRLPALIKRVVEKGSPKLLFLRILLRFAFARRFEATSRELLGLLNLKGISRRTVQRHLARLRGSRILVAEPTMRAKGQWGVPYSRRIILGRMPLRYGMNPLFVSYYVTSDFVDDETRRFLWFAERFLLGTSAFKQCFGRIMAALFKTVSSCDPSGFTKFASKIPELASLVARMQGTQRSASWMRALTFVIPEEVASSAALTMRILIDGEELPLAEAKRLGASLCP